MREFDESDHDIALSRADIQQFIRTLKVMFGEGYVFGGHRSGAAHRPAAQTYLQSRIAKVRVRIFYVSLHLPFRIFASRGRAR